MTSFTEFNLLPTLQETLIEKEYKLPTEIQQKAIPALLSGKTIVGVAQTGSGKTLAYALPILHRLKKLENEGNPVTEEAKPRACVVVPSRDLGEQVSKVFKPFTHHTRLRVRTLLGGTTFEIARRSVKGSFEVLVATPGRLVKLLEMGLINLSDVELLIFDEADQMVDKSFLSEAKRIVKDCHPNCQLGLFSATVSSPVQKLMTELFSGAEMIRSEGSHQLVETLKTENLKVIDGKRFPLLEEILNRETEGSTVIFTNTREQCDKLSQLIVKAEKECVVYRGEMDKVERRRNLKLFRDGVVKILISTDLGGRGLDIPHVERVINYHLPQQMENYIHRAGRTARAGRTGKVINFVTERDEGILEKIQKSAHKKSTSHADLSEYWPEEPEHQKKLSRIIPPGIIKHAGRERSVFKIEGNESNASHAPQKRAFEKQAFEKKQRREGSEFRSREEEVKTEKREPSLGTKRQEASKLKYANLNAIKNKMARMRVTKKK